MQSFSSLDLKNYSPKTGCYPENETDPKKTTLAMRTLRHTEQCYSAL